jgi:hypothetical protein
MDFMTREVFDTLIIAVIIIGLALAAVRLYRDFTRPLPRRGQHHWADDDTQPNIAQQPAPHNEQNKQTEDQGER